MNAEQIRGEKRIVISLGTNSGDRRAHMLAMELGIRALLNNPVFSSLMETEPVGVDHKQQAYLNRIVCGRYANSALRLLDQCLALEQRIGRERPYLLAPRTADVDIILVDGLRIDSPNLTVPHHALTSRRFLLEGCAQAAPDMREPVSGKTMRQLRDEMPENIRKQKIIFLENSA